MGDFCFLTQRAKIRSSRPLITPRRANGGECAKYRVERSLGFSHFQTQWGAPEEEAELSIFSNIVTSLAPGETFERTARRVRKTDSLAIRP